MPLKPWTWQKKIEEKANHMMETGYELVTVSITGSAKAILVFKKCGETLHE